MWLKKYYEKSVDGNLVDERGREVFKTTDAKVFVDSDGQISTPKVKHIEIQRLGMRQNFSPNLVEMGVREGWLIMANGQIIIDAKNGAGVFNVKRGPGHYCCHCEAAIPDANERTESGLTIGQIHVRDKHGNAKSPDQSNPHGYKKLNHYEGHRVLDGSEVVVKHKTAPVTAGSNPAPAQKPNRVVRLIKEHFVG